MKKILTGLVSLFFVTAFASAFSWSGLIDNKSKVITPNFEDYGFYQSNGIYLSMNQSLANNGSIRFSAEGMYRYELESYSSENILTHIADLTLLKLSGKWNFNKVNMNLNAGRFYFSDLTSAIFTQTTDGLYLAFDSTVLRTSFYAGYTGFINSLNVTMNDSASTADSQFYSLSASYVPFSASFAYKSLFGSNTLGLQAMYFFSPDGKLTDKGYGTLSLSGPIASVASYSLSATAGTEDFSNLMLYANANFSAYLSDKGLLSLGAEYASGENGPFSPFKTITYKKAYNRQGGTGTSEIFMPKASVLFVFGNLYASLTEKIVAAYPYESLTWQGSDTSLSLAYNIFSDLQLGTDIISYVDFESSAYNYFSLCLNLSLTF